MIPTVKVDLFLRSIHKPASGRRRTKRTRPDRGSREWRVQLLLKALGKLRTNISPELWRAFIPAYAEHYIYVCGIGETPCPPQVFFAEWQESQRKGIISIDLSRRTVTTYEQY